MRLWCGLSIDIDLGPRPTAMRTSAWYSVLELAYAEKAMRRNPPAVLLQYVFDGDPEFAQTARIAGRGCDRLTARNPKSVPGTSAQAL